MPATFVVVPLWQGSVSARAMSHADGASAIQGDLPASTTIVVDVPTEAGESLGTGVARYSTIRRVRELAGQALERVPDWAITIGGDCGAAVAAAAHAQSHSGGDVAVLWLDAHPDLNTPESSPSGGFGGMALRSIVGEGADGLALDEATRVAPERVVLAGVRAVDDEERRFIDEHGIVELTVEDLADPAAVVRAIEATGAGRVFVHIDLDVLDPSELDGLLDPAPFGLGPTALVRSIKALRERFPLAGATLAAYAPSALDTEQAADDAATILRIIAALD
jgi:arginase